MPIWSTAKQAVPVIVAVGVTTVTAIDKLVNVCNVDGVSMQVRTCMIQSP